MPIKTFHGDSIPFPLVSVVIPARNEESNISRTLRGITRQCPSQTELQVIVVDDGSSDRTAVKAKRAGATVVSPPKKISGGNPAIARNVGFNKSQGDPVVFLDGNRVPQKAWLNTLLEFHRKGVEVVGGSFGKPDSLILTVQCDYYCGWVPPSSGSSYSGFVSQHPPGNLSVRRKSFDTTNGYYERHPVAYAHEELSWQKEPQDQGGRYVCNWNLGKSPFLPVRLEKAVTLQRG